MAARPSSPAFASQCEQLEKKENDFRYELPSDCENENGYHTNFMNYKDALEIAKPDQTGDAATGLTNFGEHQPTLLSDVSDNRVKSTILRHVRDGNLKNYLDSVVYIEVQNVNGPSCGTGFVIPGEPLTVMTNYHVVFDEDTKNLVSPDSVQVVFYRDGVNKEVICPVTKVTRKRSEETEDVAEEGNLLHLDYIILEVDKNGNELDGSPHTVNVKHKFKCEESGRIQGMQKSQKAPYIKGIVLMCVGHPHGAPKRVSFGELITDADELKRAWYPEGKRVSAEHTCATCDGSSGSPIFAFLLQEEEEGDDVEVNHVSSMISPYFLHYRGDAESGLGMSFQSIAPDSRKNDEQNNS